MEDCAVTRWKITRHVKDKYATLFGVSASVIIVILFLWIIWSGFEVAEEPRMKNESDHSSSWAVFGGVLSIVLGFFFLAVGFPIVRDLFMKLFQQVRNPEKRQIHQVLVTPTLHGGKMKTICIISRIIVSMMAMLMFVWAIYTGIRLVHKPREGADYHLASPDGIVLVNKCPRIAAGMAVIV